MNAIQVITPPSVYPVTLEQMKLHLRVDDEGSPDTHPDDDLIEAQIGAATEWCEDYLDYAIVEQQLKLFIDYFPSTRYLTLPRSKLISIDLVQYYDTNGDLQTWDSANYSADTASTEGRLLLLPTSEWPETQERIQAVQVTYTAGYPSDDNSPADYRVNIPKRVVAAIKLLVSDLYESRQQLIIGASLANTRSAENLLHPLRRMYIR